MPKNNIQNSDSTEESQHSSKEWQSHFNLTPLADFDFIIGDKAGLPVGLKDQYPPDFKRRVLAAITSYRHNLKSIDYTLKTYVNPNLYERNEDSLGHEIHALLRDGISYAHDELIACTDRPVTRIGGMIADVNLSRLSSTLRSMQMLATRGLLFETLCLLRFALEQLAWTVKCEAMDDELAILELRALDCIGDLKNVYPPAGRLYGHLSDFAHWNPRRHHIFVDDSSGQMATILASARFKGIATLYVLLAFDMYLTVMQAIYPDSGREIRIFHNESEFDAARKTKALALRTANLFPTDRLAAEAISYFA